MSFFQNTCNPKGFGGRIMVSMMTGGHASMAAWGCSISRFKKMPSILRGGGANVKKLLEKSPQGKVTGIDYSEICVEKSKKVNKAAIKADNVKFCWEM